MLIYNHKKEFVGISEKILKTLGLSSLEELKRHCDDFASLFLKQTGYIHNFSQIHWIDYILCSYSNSGFKAVVLLNDKEFNTTITIRTIYLSDEADKKAYIIELANLTQKISGLDGYSQKQPPQTHKTQPPKTNETQSVELAPKVQPIKAPEPTIVKPVKVEPIVNKTIEPTQSVFEIKGDPDTYKFDPKQTSSELGLPLELVEEFVCDFIEQAHSFKNQLYRHLKEGDLKNLRSLAHQLKGVAANLRIQNALETLITLNTSSDPRELKHNLDKLYTITSNLAIQSHIEDTSICHQYYSDKQDQAQHDSEYAISFKQEEPQELDVTLEQDDMELSIKQPDTPKNVPHYNKEAIAQEIGLDISIFNDIFSQYLSEAKNITKEMLALANSSQQDKIVLLAKELKSMNENMRIDFFNQKLQGLINQNSSDLNEDINSILTSLEQLS